MTENYTNLESLIKTKLDFSKLEGCIVKPHIYIERALILLSDLISDYFDTT